MDNLDKLLDLANRWTRKFKAEHRRKEKELFDLRRRGRSPGDLATLKAWLADYENSLLDSEPDYEVHKALAEAMLQHERLVAWQTELGLVQ